jgi:hypothetical protein
VRKAPNRRSSGSSRAQQAAGAQQHLQQTHQALPLLRPLVVTHLYRDQQIKHGLGASHASGDNCKLALSAPRPPQRRGHGGQPAAEEKPIQYQGFSDWHG